MDKLLQPLLELSPFTIYLLIGLFCWSEGAFFLGFVTPGELAVVVGGILASRGHLEMDVLLGVVVSATIAGNATGFYVGRRWGTGMLEWAPLQRFFGPSIRLTLRVTGTQGIARTLAPGVRWLNRRFDPRLAQGLSLTLGFFALMGAIGGAGLVFSQTQAVEGLALIDFPVLEWMGKTRTDEAVSIACGGLLAFHWPGVFEVAVPLMAFAWWRVGWFAAIRIGVGVVGAAGGAYFLDRFVLEGHVPGAEFPSVPVAVAAVLLVHTTALTARMLDWGGAVACAAIGTFVLCTVALGTVVAGWAAPSGIALGLALGMAWATTLELPGTALRSKPPSPEEEQGDSPR
ncbi:MULTISPECIES: DedA family protein [unclassified Wenzhouxiangella]|uniref:DedA family protein n=1 Tax=unclassified Wenzhouxiangella TaxID=2613841 RepID=UPI000E3295A7|nr:MULTISPECIES: hypothetical protein [unclassified Wenzhouxiangella]RFF27278.1 hypothetical protein DZK25_08840 [Wenzhouxiangella sp. 15181]RFP69264.1 hypothetical protein DZK26_04580 [Wenzhouxiangella sp. 15190]